MIEQWREIPGTDGRYMASNLGRIRSHVRAKPHILRPGTHPKGYRTVVISRRTRPVHHLVALAFIGPRPFPEAHVCHWDDDPANNRLDNLRYATRGDNTRDSVRNGTHNMGSKAECKRGHKLEAPNLYPVKSGARACWACRRTQDLVNRGRIDRTQFQEYADRAYADILTGRTQSWGATRELSK